MLGNLAISVICGTVYGVTAEILGLPHPLAVALIAGDPRPHTEHRRHDRRHHHRDRRAVGQSGALIAFAIVIVVYQQIENYVLQPTIIGKAAQVSGFMVLASVLVFGALFGLIGAIIGVPIAAGIQIRHGGGHRRARRARIAAADAAVGSSSS